MTEEQNELVDEMGHVWPTKLRIRDTKFHDDMGGSGQRIYTTAGRGYKTVEYTRSDLAIIKALLRDPDQDPITIANAIGAEVRRRNRIGEDGEKGVIKESCEGAASDLVIASLLACGFDIVKRGSASALSQPVATPAPSQDAAVVEPDFAQSIATLIKDECEGGAAAGWRSCSGCHETNEGYETGRYPYSRMFGCHVGSGCSECGGIGVVWEYWSEADLEAMQRDDALAATRPAEAQVVPEGWKLVPVKPTKEMIIAGYTVATRGMSTWWKEMLAASPATGGA